MNAETENMNISLPVTGGGERAVKRSAELKRALRDFIAGCGASCYEDELNKDVLKCYSKLQNAIYVEQEIHVGESDCLCYTNLSWRPKTDDPQMVTSLVMMANDINRELKYGNFEVDSKTGEVRFRSYYEPGAMISLEDLDRLLGEPLWAIETYGAHFLELIRRGGEPCFTGTDQHAP